MWDRRYNQDNYIYGTAPNDFLKEQYQHIPQGGKVLCLGEGEGRNAVYLAQQGYHVTAVDLSSVGLKKAIKLAEKKGVTITTEVANLADYDLGINQWDGIISIWLHMPQNIRQKLHQRVEPALKKKGVFILEAYTLEHLNASGKGGPPASNPENFMSLKQLQNELGQLRQIVGIEKQRTIDEGDMHQGLSAVVQFVVEK